MTSRAGLLWCICGIACGPLRGETMVSGEFHRDALSEPGGVVLTEVMLDPMACHDVEGEWVEITNVSSEPFDLADLILVDLDGNTSAITSFLVEPGLSAHVGRDTFGDCGPVPDAFVGPISLNNQGEQLALRHAETHLLLDSTPHFPDSVPGESWVLDPSQLTAAANDDLHHWKPSGETGMAPTPGDLNPSGQAGNANWFGMHCIDAQCTLPNDFDPFDWIEQGWFHAQAEMDAQAPGNPLMFIRVTLWADSLDPAQFETSQLGMNLEFASPSWDEDEEWWAVVAMNRQFVNTEPEAPNEEVLYLDDPAEIRERMQGFTLAQAAAELAETDPDFRISFGGYQWYTGDPNPTLELGDGETFREVHWDAATGVRHDPFGTSFPF